MPVEISANPNSSLVPQALPGEFDNWLATLRRKWSTVPAAGEGRIDSQHLLKLSDPELRTFWQQERQRATTGANFPVRGWYHELYKDVFRGKKVLDVGAGLGLDGLTFAQHGADMILLDIVPSNVELHRRLAGLLGVKVQHMLLEDLTSLDAVADDLDVVWAQGSLINAPFEFIRQEAQILLEHLPVGGRWVELAYPKERWEREGRMPFEKWGQKTDGPGTPWVEWYDLDKLRQRLAPARFDVVLAFNYHNDDFNWFDLLRQS